MGLHALSAPLNSLYAVLLVFWLAITVLYRRFFHPLARIPGPFLPAVTPLYGFYFNLVKGGVFYLEIERLHGIYGMVKLHLPIQKEQSRLLPWFISIFPRTGAKRNMKDLSYELRRTRST
jgi:hypothetical protein